jgi:hypothetical protein
MKSEVRDQLEIMHAIYQDACMQCTDVVSDSRDLDYIEARVISEGLSFLTITLPNFCRDFERCLAEGEVSASAFLYFRKTGAIPSFLKGMLGRLFDQETGRIIDFEIDHPPIVAAVRQVCLLFKKVELECSPQRRAQALANYVDVERLNSCYDAPEPDDPFYRVSDLLWGSVLAGFNAAALVPRHGPGAVVEGDRGNAKYLWQRWHDRLESFLPFWGAAYHVRAYGDEELGDVAFVSSEEESPVKVIFVPKTLKSPRVIAIEPKCMQYAQQALRDFLYTRIESHCLTAGRINFSDQSENQRLALASSKSGRFATIDLSDASDRVPLSVVTEMLRSCPELRDAILACRSTSAKLPNGEIITPLSKFASMGSALCFPVEAMYFFTIMVLARLRKYDLPVTWGSIQWASRDTRVYGDDLIMPTEDAVAVSDLLQQYNCKVNANKSFWTGRFRESCGVDGYAGEVVTPLYLRHLRPSDRRNTQSVLSWVATANAFRKRGYALTAQFMYHQIELLLGPLPEVTDTSSVVGKVVANPKVDRTTTKWRYNPLIQQIEILCWVPSPVKSRDEIDGYPALQKCLLTLERRVKREQSGPATVRLNRRDELLSRVDDLEVPWTAGFGWLSEYIEGAQPSPVDKRHLERSVVRGALTLKRRWQPVS